MLEVRERAADRGAGPAPVRVPGDNLVTVFADHAHNRRDHAAVVQLGSDGAELARLTYGQVFDNAARLAGQLSEHTEPGDRALLVHGSSLEFTVAFVGCLLAGVVGVPVPVPDGSVGGVRTHRLNRIADDCRPRLVLTDQSADGLDIAGLPILDSVVGIAERAIPDEPGGASPDQLAMLQYTSGSTGTPRGVRITHSNFVANLRAAVEAQNLGERTADEVIFVSWLPHFHDMGLAQVLAPMLIGGTAICMAPTSFLRSPVSWLDAISRYRGHSAASPNFGYDRCTERITPAQKAGLDLSSWRIALNGSEPVRPQTLAAFTREFADQGFAPEAFHPSYGMAEATVYVSGFRRNDDVRTLTVSGSAIDDRGLVELDPPAGDDREYVGCGRWAANMDLRIADPATGAMRGPDEVGEICLSGASVSAGYWSADLKATGRGSGPGPELRTGDLGFVHDDQLFIIGRLDAMMIVNGRNHHAEDVERTAEQAHPALLPGGAAAFLARPDAARKAVTIVCETQRKVDRGASAAGTGAVGGGREELARQIVAAVRAAVSAEHYLAVAEVVLLRPGTLPRTSSGKVQRDRCRALLAEGELRPWQ